MEEELKSELEWDEYYIELARTAARRSKDPSSKVGAVIVKGNTLVAGYNGFPRGVRDFVSRWERPHKYDFVVHAELNAILNAPFDCTGATLYLTHFGPCNECAKAIIQAGIRRVVCGEGVLSPQTTELVKISEEMFLEAGVELVKYRRAG